MIRRVVSLVSFGLIVLIAISMNGCCDAECEMQKGVYGCGMGTGSWMNEGQENSWETSETGDLWDTGNLPDTSELRGVLDTSDTANTGFEAVYFPGPGAEAAENIVEREQSRDESHFKTAASNGFVYPLDVVSSWSNTYDYAGYGACGTSYYTNTCHNGTDIGSARGSSVYAIAAGKVVKVSGTQNSTCSSGWGYDYGGASTCNMAVAVQHYAADGSAFVVVYGHLVYSSSVAVGTTYSPGDTIGVIANDYDRSSSSASWSKTSSPHLHFGVFPGTSSPAVRSGYYGWGKLTCSGASQAASTTLPSSCTNNGSTAMGTYIGAKKWTAPPGAPTLSSPSNGASVTSPVALSWVNSSGTYRSHVMVCTNSSLTTGCMNPDGGMTGQEPTTAFTTSYSATLSKATYYWAVRGIAYNDYGGWGSYSSVRSFTVR